jgi:hypothetical protein
MSRTASKINKSNSSLVRGIEIQDSASEMEQLSSHEDLEHVLKRVGSVSMEQKLNQLRTASK